MCCIIRFIGHPVISKPCSNNFFSASLLLAYDCSSSLIFVKGLPYVLHPMSNFFRHLSLERAVFFCQLSVFCIYFLAWLFSLHVLIRFFELLSLLMKYRLHLFDTESYCFVCLSSSVFCNCGKITKLSHVLLTLKIICKQVYQIFL